MTKISSSWNHIQKDFWQYWQKLRNQYAVFRKQNIPRASWPNENTSILDEFEKPRHNYYKMLNEIHFANKKQIILEVGTDSRWCWSSTIDKQNHVVVRTTWSLHKDDPDIWQIPIQDLISLLDTPQNRNMTSEITTLIMENTLDCLPLDVIDQLFAFVKKYNIQMIALKYRPLSVPSLDESQRYIEMGNFDPNIECPSLLLASRELLDVMISQAEASLGILYLYRPPIGCPMIVPYQLKKKEGDFQKFQNLQQEANKNPEAIRLLLIPPNLLYHDKNTMTDVEYAELYREILGDLLMHIWALHERPQTIYRVHMLQDVFVPQITLTQAWFLGMANIAEQYGLDTSIQLDEMTVLEKGYPTELLHTADGECIEPQEFIREWGQRGFRNTEILQKYAYGHIGNTEILPFSFEKNIWGDEKGIQFQVSRLMFRP